MLKRAFVALLAFWLTSAPVVVQADSAVQSAKLTTKEALTDAAIVALIIAGSIAAYKAAGKPCACPSDTARNGSSCGGRSAWSRAGGAKPLCFPTDVSAAMVQAHRATKAIPSPF